MLSQCIGYGAVVVFGIIVGAQVFLRLRYGPIVERTCQVCDGTKIEATDRQPMVGGYVAITEHACRNCNGVGYFRSRSKTASARPRRRRFARQTIG